MKTSTTRARARRPRVTLWALRAVLTVHLLLALAQPVLAGRYLVGDLAAIAWHGGLGSSLALTALLIIVLAIPYCVIGRGRWWLPPHALLLWVAVVFQIGFGYARDLGIHIPLGVGIVLASIALFGWVWSPAAAGPAPTRASRRAATERTGNDAVAAPGVDPTASTAVAPGVAPTPGLVPTASTAVVPGVGPTPGVAPTTASGVAAVPPTSTHRGRAVGGSA